MRLCRIVATHCSATDVSMNGIRTRIQIFGAKGPYCISHYLIRSDPRRCLFAWDTGDCPRNVLVFEFGLSKTFRSPQSFPSPSSNSLWDVYRGRMVNNKALRLHLSSMTRLLVPCLLMHCKSSLSPSCMASSSTTRSTFQGRRHWNVFFFVWSAFTFSGPRRACDVVGNWFSRTDTPSLEDGLPQFRSI